MAIDPDVQAELDSMEAAFNQALASSRDAVDADLEEIYLRLDEHSARLSLLAQPVIPLPPPPPPPPVPLPPVPDPLPPVLPLYPFQVSRPQDLKVRLPRGPMAPLTTSEASATNVANWDGTYWRVFADWDEDVEGAHLVFDGPIIWNGHTLVGVHQTMARKPGDRGRSMNEGGGRGHRILIDNPARVQVSDVFGVGHWDIQGFTILDPVGDGLRPSTDSTFTDGYIRIVALPDTAKHYDGAQHHNAYGAATGQDRNNCVYRRLVFELQAWGPGASLEEFPQSVGGMNAAMFWQADNVADISDILVLEAAGCWFPIRLTSRGSGGVVRNVQLMGRRGHPNKRPDRLAPASFLLYRDNWDIDWDTVYVNVEGVKKGTVNL